MASVGQVLRPAGRNHTGVDTGPAEAAEETRMFDLHAVVHDDVQASGARLGGGGFVDDADLHPEATGADRDGFVGNRRDLFASAKAVDQIDPASAGPKRFGRRGYA